VGRQICAAGAADGASRASAWRPESTACCTRQTQKKNPPDWSGGLETFIGGVSAGPKRRALGLNSEPAW